MQSHGARTYHTYKKSETRNCCLRMIHRSETGNNAASFRTPPPLAEYTTAEEYIVDRAYGMFLNGATGFGRHIARVYIVRSRRLHAGRFLFFPPSRASNCRPVSYRERYFFFKPCVREFGASQPAAQRLKA